jgi:hypothetical protein
MTPQLKLVATGIIAAGVSKFAFGKSWGTAFVFGLGAISVTAILLAKEDK